MNSLIEEFFFLTEKTEHTQFWGEKNRRIPIVNNSYAFELILNFCTR
jgi:hypothetical protein